MVAFVRDASRWAGKAAPDLAPSDPLIEIHFHDTEIEALLGSGGLKPGQGDPDEEGTPVVWEPSMRFGLVMRGAGPHQRLTFDERGGTNNTCVRLDDHEWLFGERPFRTRDGGTVGDWPGRWKDRDVGLGEGRQGRKSVWVYDHERVEVTQTVELVTGPQSGLPDTC